MGGERSFARRINVLTVPPKAVIRATASPDVEVGTVLEARNRQVMLAEFLCGGSPFGASDTEHSCASPRYSGAAYVVTRIALARSTPDPP